MQGTWSGVEETPHISWIKDTVGQSLFLSTTFSVGYFSILSWPECLFEFFCNGMKNLSERFGQPSTENVVSNWCQRHSTKGLWREAAVPPPSSRPLLRGSRLPFSNRCCFQVLFVPFWSQTVQTLPLVGGSTLTDLAAAGAASSHPGGVSSPASPFLSVLCGQGSHLAVTGRGSLYRLCLASHHLPAPVVCIFMSDLRLSGW